MVIYDQRTAISVTRLSANAFLIFSPSLSSLLLFIGLLQNLHIYTPASTILGVFPPGADHFESTQSLGEYAQISAALLPEEGKVFTPTLGLFFHRTPKKC